MRYLINGANGQMGRMIRSLLDAEPDTQTVLVDPNGEGMLHSVWDCALPVDCVMDFSQHTACRDVAAFAVERGTPLLMGTTGHTPEEKALILRAGERIPVFYSPTLSRGIAMLRNACLQVLAAFPRMEVEIVETHHDRKADAPSGTALLLAEAMAALRPGSRVVCGRTGSGRRDPLDIGVSSLRLSREVGTHTVYFSDGTQTLTLQHRAEDRALFAQGAVEAARWLTGRARGIYTMFDLIQ